MITTTNPYKRFQHILGGHTRAIAEVVFVDSDGTSIVELRSGQRFRARGANWTQGTKVWVVDGEIKSEAPGLSSYSVTV